MSESKLILSPYDTAPAQPAKDKVIHRQKFMGGQMTPEEAHRKWGIGRRCQCGAPGAGRIKVFMPLDELLKRAPNFVAMVMAANPDESGKLPTVRFKEHSGDTEGKDYIKASDVVYCENCRVEARLAAAKGAPSWAVVEIDDGKKDKISVGYGD